MRSLLCSILVAGAVACAPAVLVAQQAADILIRGGTVIDGTGAPRRRADVAIRADRITFVGDASRARITATRTIDATGLVVAPGFIDPHTHSAGDLSNAQRKGNVNYLMQGVTTVINNNDGGGPIDIAGQLAEWAKNGIGTNTAVYIGQGSVRRAVMGMSDQAPTAAQLDSMKKLVARAMDDGAIGMSTGLFYAPGSYATTEEVIELAKVAAAKGGRYDSHIRDESSYTIGLIAAVNEVIRIGREARMPVHISHIKALGVDVWGQSDTVIALMRRARAEGIDITASQYPYTASGSSVGASLLPRWAEAGGADSLRARLADPATRQRLVAEMTENLRRRGGANSLLITGGRDSTIRGKRLDAVARMWSVSPIEAAIRIIQNGGASVASFNMNEKDIVNFLKPDFISTDSDGSGGHPRLYGAFPKFFREYVREKKVMSLERGVQRSSSASAAMLGIRERGTLAPDNFADVIVFDPATFTDRATYEEPTRLATGMKYVLVNGAVAVDNGQYTGATPGRVLRGAAARMAQSPSPDGPVFADGMAQVVPAFQDTTKWIRQNLWVETDFDSDRDGRNDRVHVDVTRPAQTATGLKVPVLYHASPYHAGVSPQEFEGWDVKQELGADPPRRNPLQKPPYRGDRTRISNSLLSYVSRGFAVVHSEQPGTGRSQGCPTVGDWPERAPMKFVIDWLNGRAKGYTAPVGGDTVNATSWSTGKVGMIGTSYDGTLALAAATTGVQGLEVVIPIAPNTSYYHYYRANGLVRSPGGYLGEDVDVLYDFIASGDTVARATCDQLWKYGAFAGRAGMDRQTGDYSDFWEARDLLPHVKNIRAAVLLAHGLNDYNVMPSHSVRIYDEMRARGQPVSLYLHQGGHGGGPPADMVNRWFTRYLHGVENGVNADGSAWIVTASPTPASAGAPPARAAASPFPSYPVPGSLPVMLHPTPGGNAVGALSLAPARGVQEKLTDDVALSGSALASAGRSLNRLVYATPTLTDTVHISGTVRVTLRVAANRPAANLSVWLVTLPYDSSLVGSEGHAGVVTRGWADVQNYKSLTKGGNFAAKQPGEPLVPGQFYDVTFDLEPDDQIIPAGKRLAVMIMSSDRQFTLWPQPGTQLTVDLARSSLTIPIVGGTKALVAAGALPATP